MALHDVAGSVPDSNRLFDLTLSAATASIDTNGFSLTGYQDLLIYLRAGSSKAASNDSLYFTVNNDTGSHYSWGQFNVHGTSTSPGGTEGGTTSVPSATTPFWIPGTTATELLGAVKVEIHDYAGAHNHFITGTFFYQISGTNNQVGLGQELWSGGAAITRLAVTATGGSLVAGSRLTVYGLGPV
jgi:hypothetical protein